MNRAVIIVAGGSGSRMGGQLPKQFIPLAGQPLLMHSIKAFHEAFPDIHIVIALPAGHMTTWKNLCANLSFTLEHEIVQGGETRFHSVSNALPAIKTSAFVAIHDGARPLITIALIHAAFLEATVYGNAIPAIPVNESVRYASAVENYPVDRDLYKIIQTPQVFNTEILLHAYQTGYNESFTDDATVVEQAGHSIHLIPGDPENIKITRPADLLYAESLLTSRQC